MGRGADGWNVEVAWTSRGLKPYFSDFVVHRGHAFEARIKNTPDQECATALTQIERIALLRLKDILP